MSARRIGDRGLEAPAGAGVAGHTTGRSERLGAALASPIGILLVVPGLVAAVGLFLTLLGQRALRDSTAQLGRDRFSEQTDFIARSIASSLAQSDAVLDRMRERVVAWSPADPAGPVAHSLRGLIRGRAGVAYVSLSYPDGTFRGAYLEGALIRFKEVRSDQGERIMSVFDLEGLDGLAPRTREPTTYDPTTRDFYRLAVEMGRRVWTKPYPFFGSHQTGVSRTEPVFEAGSRTVRAVLTADFDVHALSESMAHAPIAGARTLLYTRDGTLLAYPEGAAAMARVPLRIDRPLAHGDLGDPVIDAFFASQQREPSSPGTFSEFSAGGETALAMVTPVPGFPELGWNVAAIVPRSAFFSARTVHERQSSIAAALSLLIALGVAVVFSRHVVRVRRDAAVARDLAREATDRMRELGSYRLIERIGQGAMGEVWRAEHRLLARQAAIKLIREEMLASGGRKPAELIERFRREAQTLATLRSRHTTLLFDYGVTEDGTFYFVMELLDGMDLETLVHRHGPQPPDRVIRLLIQVCSSLAEAHAAGLVHRDIKPANVFVCRAADEVDVVKVLDFGIVQGGGEQKEAPLAASASVGPGDGRLTHAGQHVGSPAVMAPEQIRGQDIDGRADLYSLGCVAVWLLSGRMPFLGETAFDMMGAHLYTAVPALASLVSGDLPAELDRILRQCLEKGRDDRPRDAGALAEALRAIVVPPGDAWTAQRAAAWWAERVASGRAG
jgi:tRNA A-37 threonylcarbamoyl transferase component Bud32